MDNNAGTNDTEDYYDRTPWDDGPAAPRPASPASERQPTQPPESPDAGAEDVPDPFTTNPMDYHGMPLAHYTDPKGYGDLAALLRASPHWYPSWMHYEAHCPHAVAIGRTLYHALPSYTVWGKHTGPKKWTKIVAGRSAPRRKFRQPKLSLTNVLAALCNPSVFAVGNSDEWMAEDQPDWDAPPAQVAHLRIDVDMKDAWTWGRTQDVAEELAWETHVCGALGMTAHFFRTGSRGHQLVIPTPRIARSVAGLALLMLRYLLVVSRRRRGQIDRTNLDSLMRLPVGRHYLTHNVGWMLDAASGLIVPLDGQAQAVTDAFVYQGRGCDALAEDADDLAHALAACGHDRDRDVLAETKMEDGPRFAVLAGLLQRLPESPLVTAFREACGRLGVPSLRAGVETAGGAAPAAPRPAEEDLEDDLHAALEGVRAVRPVAVRPRVRVGKGWARGVIDGEFRPGDFHRWTHVRGDNAIAAAIIVCDGDRVAAERLLVEIAQRIDGSPDDKAARLSWIEWCVPRNNVDLHYGTVGLRPHRNLDGDVLPTETALAEKVVQRLVERRAASDLRRRAFPAKALVTIRHIVELVQIAFRVAEAEAVALSARTLAAAIRGRWPADATSDTDVQRQMEWITAGPRCLFIILEPVTTPRTAYQPLSYRLGGDLISLIPVDTAQ